MISELSIFKQFGTYTDLFLLLGLARIAALTQLQLSQYSDVQLIDTGVMYRIQLRDAISPTEILQKLEFEHLFDPVKSDKTEALADLPWEQVRYFDAVHHREIRNCWRDYQRQKSKLNLAAEDAPPKPDPRTQNAVILTQMRHELNKHNKLWQESQLLKDDFSGLVAAIFQAFNGTEPERSGSAIATYFKQFTGKSLPKSVSATQLFIPTAVQGVNRRKADSNIVDSGATESWVILWLIAAGLFHYGISERIKVSDRQYDWRVVALAPKEISLFHYSSVLDKLRRFNPPSGTYGIARFDAETVLNFSLELLTYHSAKDNKTTIRQRGRGRSIKQFVNGLIGTHFGSKGQVHGVKELFNLGLPDWIRPSTYDEVIDYQMVLQEHLKVVKALSGEKDAGELLSAYRDFITSSDLGQFFRFQVRYADFATKQLIFPLLSHSGLEIMLQSFDKPDQTWSITEITQNRGFQRIARAINSATLYAGKIKTKAGTLELEWQRTYGLAQRLSNHADSKKDFIAELMAFLTSYENENLRLSEKLQAEGKTLRRVWVTHEDLEAFLPLLDDKRFSCNLVANLLLAYGYAKWRKSLAGDSSETDTTDED
jgi:hypothetical protein